MPSFFYEQEAGRGYRDWGSWVGGLSPGKPCRILLGFTFSTISAILCVIWHLHTINLYLKYVYFLNKPFWRNSGSKWRHRSLLNSPSTTDTSNLQLYIEQLPLKEIQKLAEWFLHIGLRRKSPYYPHQNGADCNPKQ